MSADPRMIKIGQHTAARFMKRAYRRIIVVRIRIRAVQIPRWVGCTSQAVHTLVIVHCTSAVVVRTPRCLTKHTKVVVKGMVLLHHDDDVLKILQVSIGQSAMPAQKDEQ